MCATAVLTTNFWVDVGVLIVAMVACMAESVVVVLTPFFTLKEVLKEVLEEVLETPGFVS